MIVNFKYERLTRFCFICGLLGHMDRLCDKLFTTPEADIKKQWGIWLREPTRKNANTEGSRWLRDDDSIVMPDNTDEGICQGHGHRCSLNDDANMERNLIGAPNGERLAITDLNVNQRQNKTYMKEDFKDISQSNPNQITVHDS